MSATVDRQAMFSGTEAPPAHLELDSAVLTEWLAPRIDNLGKISSIAKFKGGQSNPTYLVEASGGCFVLRRKPPGALVKSAHAIDREYRVMSAMCEAGIAVARPRLYCDDESVIGSEFYIADFVGGRVFWQAELPGVAHLDRAAIYVDLNRTFAAIHAIDPASVGLGDLGPTENYATRNLKRWSQIYVGSQLVSVPDMDWLMAELVARLPAAQPATLIHGDYGLYNVIVEQDGTRILAVLDWEMATLGDPLIDLAHHLRAWWDIPDAGGSATSLRGEELSALGIPTMEEYLASYCAARAILVPDMDWYFAYAQFRYAAMIQGILKRAADGTASSRVVLHRQERVPEIAALARRTLTDGWRATM
jgi:aminoglycoside phosphotransferase (APT) family kinase protein